MRLSWQRLSVFVALLALWAVFAAWQHHEYGHQRELAQQTLVRQADSLARALVGGIRSHRRLGRFLEAQLQGVLDDLVEADDILAVAVAAEGSPPILSAGQTHLLPDDSPRPGSHWDPAGYRLVMPFELSPAMPGGGPPRGGGWGRGGGGGPWWQRDEAGEMPEGPFTEGGQFFATLLLDRRATDLQVRNAARTRAFVVLAGAVALACVAVVWQTSVRLTETRGRARVLEAEARHFRELSQAATGLAHETRNPLGLIRGWTQRLAATGFSTPEQQRQAQSVVEECDRVTARINQFLAFARPCTPRVEAVDPDELLDELAVLLQPDLDGKQLQVHHAPAAKRRTIQADRELFRQALFNLMQNAVQFSPEGGAVEVSVGSDNNGACRIEVADRGPGVAPEHVDDLFTPYFTTRSDGTGLGLAIVRRIAAAHGWQVAYTPRPGGGSVFRLEQMHG